MIRRSPHPHPGPIDPVALYSRAYRDERHRAWGLWCGVAEDGLEDFVVAMERAWRNQQAAELGDGPDEQIGVAAPKIYAPRIGRAA